MPAVVLVGWSAVPPTEMAKLKGLNTEGLPAVALLPVPSAGVGPITIAMLPKLAWQWVGPRQLQCR